MATFCYDLSRELLSFDFFGWLVQAKAAGASEITFDLSNFERDAKRDRRITSILAPGPALADLSWRLGGDGDRMALGSSRMGALVRFAQDNPSFERLRSYLPPNRRFAYTVTLRRQANESYRNSNNEAWLAFASEIGALVIADYDDDPLDLHTRMALYAGARLNLGVACGPLMLCSLTDYPVLMLAWGKGSQHLVLQKYGIPRGGRAPWCRDYQWALWDDDDLESIRRAFNSWERAHGKIGHDLRRQHEGASPAARGDGGGHEGQQSGARP